jgi:hypothetical protein
VKISRAHTGDPELDGWTVQHHLVYELSSISIATITEYSSICIKPLRKTLLDFEYRAILPSPHLDSL